MLSFIKNIFKGTLRKACKKGDIEAVKQHLAAGADVNAGGVFGTTPLHKAAWHGHKEVAELLIAAGADVNAKKAVEGETPLHEAAYFGHKEVAELLIAGGADVNAKTKGSGMLVGDTPADTAIKYYSQSSQKEDAARKETADLLRQHGGKTKKELKAEGK